MNIYDKNGWLDIQGSSRLLIKIKLTSYSSLEQEEPEKRMEYSSISSMMFFPKMRKSYT